MISGNSEMVNVVQGRVPVLDFTIENVILHNKAVWEQNSILFTFNSVDALKQELRRYFDPLKAGVEFRAS